MNGNIASQGDLWKSVDRRPCGGVKTQEHRRCMWATRHSLNSLKMRSLAHIYAHVIATAIMHSCKRRGLDSLGLAFVVFS